MLPLAQWIMQGRSQALVFVVVALATSPWLWPNSILVAAAINLIWLRHGSKEGLFTCLWATLPAVVIIYFMGNFMPMFIVATAAVSSQVLRMTRSWPYGLIALSACGLITSIGLELFAQTSMQIYVDLYRTFLDDLMQQIPDKDIGQMLTATLDTAFVAGLFGSMLMMAGFISLALARSWQAKLYNPGGFQQEFHQLRLGRIDIVIAVVLTIVFYQMGMQYLTWVWIALFPLLIAGVALFHAIAKSKNLAIQWYILFYCVLAFWEPFKIIIVLATIVDSVTDIRNKLAKRNTDTER